MKSWLPYLALVFLLPPRSASAVSYAEWRSVNFTAVELGDDFISGDLVDPDGDGFGNLLEFAFALDPWSPDAVSRGPTLGQDDGFLTFSYRARSDATGLACDFQVSDTLDNWITVNNPVVLSTASLDGAWWRTLRDPAEAHTQPRRFLRLRVLETASVATLFIPPDNASVALEIPLKARLQWSDQTTLETG